MLLTLALRRKGDALDVARHASDTAIVFVVVGSCRKRERCWQDGARFSCCKICKLYAEGVGASMKRPTEREREMEIQSE